MLFRRKLAVKSHSLLFYKVHPRGSSAYSVVTLQEAKTAPRFYNQMPNDILITMAVMGDQEAREERLIREIMTVDELEYDLSLHLSCHF